MKNQPLKNSYLVLAVLFAAVVLMCVGILALNWLPMSAQADALAQAVPAKVVKAIKGKTTGQTVAPVVKSTEEQQLENLDLTLPQSDFDTLQNDINGL